MYACLDLLVPVGMRREEVVHPLAVQAPRREPGLHNAIRLVALVSVEQMSTAADDVGGAVDPAKHDEGLVDSVHGVTLSCSDGVNLAVAAFDGEPVPVVVTHVPEAALGDGDTALASPLEVEVPLGLHTGSSLLRRMGS